MPLKEYKRKRRFDETPEPAGKIESKSGRRFVVQKHRASHLHYDFRLEMEGVLKSWAVPKGPSLVAADKRLAMMVEDHPVSYFHFEGTIPEGNYGAGTVMVWDTGTWEPLGDASAMLKAGDLKFRLDGKKLKGEFVLARMRSRRPGSKGTEWLLIKKRDGHETSGYDIDAFDSSVLTGRSLREIAGDEGSAEWKSSRKASSRKTPAKDAWLAESLKKAEKAASSKKAARPAKALDSAAKKTVSKAEPASASNKKKVDPELLLSEVDGAERSAMPRGIHPMLATLVDKPFDDEQWLFELKWDGYRAIAFIEEGKVRLVSRNQNEFHDYPELQEIAKSIKASKAILDGEIVALDDEGRSSFSLMQQRTGLSGNGGRRRGAKKMDVPILYYAFDLLYLDGYSLGRVELEKRKELLRAISTDGPLLRYSDHYLAQGTALYEAAKQRNLEGIVGKRRASGYLQKRSREWLKIKITQQQECVIGGYTDPKGSRENFGSLVLGLYDEKRRLIPVGQAGSGFTQESHAAMWQRLKKLEIAKSPFAEKPESTRGLHYVRPELVAQIKFTEWTHEGESGAVRMRAPVFQGLRADKKPQECRFERVKSAKAEAEKAESGDAA